MAFLDCFEEEMQTHVKIYSPGEITGFALSGQPIRGQGVVKYDGLAGFGQLSSSEQFVNDRMNNPSTHKIIIDPLKLTGEVLPEDEAEVTKNGKLEIYTLYNGENALDLDEVYVVTGSIKR